MDLDFDYVAERLQCSYEDKVKCLDTLKYIIYLANTARREGILALEKEMYAQNNPLLKKGIEIILNINSKQDGVIKDILFNYIIAGDYKGKDFLEAMIIVNGVIELYNGNNPRFIEKLLLSYFGDDFIKGISKVELYKEDENGNFLTREELDKLLNN